MINREDFSQKRPGLKAEMIGAHNRAIFTIQKVEEVEIPDNTTNAPRKALAVTFEEFPDHAYWPNGTSIGHLIDALGNDENKWVGKRVPIEKVKANNPTTGRVQDSLWVAEAKKWDEYLKGAKNGAAQKTVAKKPARR
jgi:hypothetical protein